jgi:hypothetical protein
VQVLLPLQAATSGTPVVAWVDDPFILKFLYGSILQGAAVEHFVVPLESVNGVADTVRFHPSPEPVASIAVIVAVRCTMVSYPERVSDQASADGAAIESEPGVTVAVPVIVQAADKRRRPC